MAIPRTFLHGLQYQDNPATEIHAHPYVAGSQSRKGGAPPSGLPGAIFLALRTRPDPHTVIGNVPMPHTDDDRIGRPCASCTCSRKEGGAGPLKEGPASHGDTAPPSRCGRGSICAGCLPKSNAAPPERGCHLPGTHPLKGPFYLVLVPGNPLSHSTIRKPILELTPSAAQPGPYLASRKAQ